MTSSKSARQRRREERRRRGARQPVFRGDFPGDDHDITEAIQAIPPAPWHGTTMPLSALRDQPRYAPPEPASHPYPAPPAAVLHMPQARAVMTVYPPAAGGPAPTPQALEVVRFLRARVLILRNKEPSQLDRISDEKLRLVPGDRATNRRTTARLIVDEATELLRCSGDPR